MLRPLATAAAALALGVTLGGCAALGVDLAATTPSGGPSAPATDTPTSPGTTSGTHAPGSTPAVALARLATLAGADRHPAVPDYDRRAFGTAWADTDHNGCNQRDDVLLRDAVPGTVRVRQQGRCDHDVLAGSWVDPYTGRTLTFTDLKDLRQAQAVQIDHLVPLAEAWVSGAYGWTDERRRSFATDLDELVAVDGPANASKSDGDPAAWRPRHAFQCTYAVRWIDTKARWHLAVDASERRALAEMLATC